MLKEHTETYLMGYILCVLISCVADEFRPILVFISLFTGTREAEASGAAQE